MFEISKNQKNFLEGLCVKEVFSCVFLFLSF